MALTLVCQLGVAAALLFIGVCLGMQSRRGVESPMHRAVRFTSIGLAALLFILYVGESAGFGPSLDTAFQWVVLRVQHFWQTGTSLLWSVF
jgi:hypothetical protein